MTRNRAAAAAAAVAAAAIALALAGCSGASHVDSPALHAAPVAAVATPSPVPSHHVKAATPKPKPSHAAKHNGSYSDPMEFGQSYTFADKAVVTIGKPVKSHGQVVVSIALANKGATPFDPSWSMGYGVQSLTGGNLAETSCAVTSHPDDYGQIPLPGHTVRWTQCYQAGSKVAIALAQENTTGALAYWVIR